MFAAKVLSRSGLRCRKHRSHQRALRAKGNQSPNTDPTKILNQNSFLTSEGGIKVPSCDVSCNRRSILGFWFTEFTEYTKQLRNMDPSSNL